MRQLKQKHYISGPTFFLPGGLARAPGIGDLVKALAGINQSQPHTPGDLMHHGVCVPDAVDRPEDSRIDPPVVNDKPSFPLTPVLRERFRRERWAGPLAVSSDQLARLHFSLELGIHPFRLFSLQRFEPTV